jgi:hypothetical protein
MVSERETVVELPWLRTVPCLVEAANRVTINCWYQRQCGAVGVHLRWRRELSKAGGKGGANQLVDGEQVVGFGSLRVAKLQPIERVRLRRGERRAARTSAHAQVAAANTA